ncbi:MAG TPA: hypothetical protein VF874_22435 [Mycobacterium sp.]
MGPFGRRAVRLISVAAVGAVVVIAPVIGAPGTETHVAICPRGMVDNPAGYGCVPYAPGVGAPSQEVLTRCHGNYYICVWPYPVP